MQDMDSMEVDFRLSLNHPIGVSPNWQSLFLRPFQKARRREMELISRGKMLQRAGAIGKKALLLDPASCNSLANM